MQKQIKQLIKEVKEEKNEIENLKLEQLIQKKTFEAQIANKENDCLEVKNELEVVKEKI